MNEPIRQHIVPRCYLKNFALKRKKSWFVDVCDVTKKPHTFFNSSVDNICVAKDYYTFKKVPDKDKRFLERYYSQTIESDYNEIYDALINPAITNVSENLRFKIISFVVAQFFRTQKFTKTFNGQWEQVLRRGYDMMKHHSNSSKLYFDNDEGKETFIDFEGRSLDEVIKEETESNREQINLQGYVWFRQLTAMRLKDVISVYKVNAPYKFISSDHPVVINPPPLNLTNHITMPLDSYHLVAIMSTMGEPILTNNKAISRILLHNDAARLRVLTSNLIQIEQCVQHIFGHKDAVAEAMKMHSETSHEQLHEELSNHIIDLQKNGAGASRLR